LLAGGEHEVTLVQGRRGVFDIRRDGQLVYSKKTSGRYPTDAELDALIAK
jgi:selT/selW/selH-like putative selenoprotein